MATESVTLDDLLARVKALEKSNTNLSNIVNKVNSIATQHGQWEVLYSGSGGLYALVGIPKWIKKIIIYGSYDVENATYLAKRWTGAPTTSLNLTNLDGNRETRLRYVKTVDDYMFYALTNGSDSGDNGVFIIGTATDLYYKSVDIASRLFARIREVYRYVS